MKKTVLLHVGPHKTGTTTIQGNLHENRGRLREAGIVYPDAGLGKTTHAFYGHHNLAWELLGDKRFKPEAGTWRDVADLIRTAPEARFILSSEAFSTLEPGQMDALREKLAPFDTKVVYFARNQVDLLQSGIYEAADKYFTRNPLRYLKKRMRVAKFRLHDAAEAWSSRFGHGNVVARVFEDERGNLPAALLRCFGAEDLIPPGSLKRYNSARSLFFIQSNIALCSAVAGKVSPEVYNAEIASTLNKAAVKLGLARGSEDLISQEDADEITAYFRGQNGLFSERYTKLPEVYFKGRIMNTAPKAEFDERALNILCQVILDLKKDYFEERLRVAKVLKKRELADQVREKLKGLDISLLCPAFGCWLALGADLIEASGPLAMLPA